MITKAHILTPEWEEFCGSPGVAELLVPDRSCTWDEKLALASQAAKAVLKLPPDILEAMIVTLLMKSYAQDTPGETRPGVWPNIKS